MILNYDSLKHYFNVHSLSKYALLPIKDQNGILPKYLDELKNNFHFKEKEILVLAKLSGRFIPHILTFFNYHQSDLDKLFEDNPPFFFPSLKFIDTDENVHQLTHLDERGRWFIYMIELHQYCTNEPLSLDELHQIKKYYPLVFSNHFVKVKLLVQLIGIFSQSKRIHLWKILFSNPNLCSKKCILKLCSLPADIRLEHINATFHRDNPPRSDTVDDDTEMDLNDTHKVIPDKSEHTQSLDLNMSRKRKRSSDYIDVSKIRKTSRSPSSNTFDHLLPNLSDFLTFLNDFDWEESIYDDISEEEYNYSENEDYLIDSMNTQLLSDNTFSPHNFLPEETH